MEKLTTTLLTGAAMTAFAVAPAMAGQHGALPLGHSRGIAVKMATGVKFLNGNLHRKTDVNGLHQPGKTNYYTTYTFTTFNGFCYHTVTNCPGSRTWEYAGTFGTWYKVKKELASAVIWESSSCAEITSRYYSCHMHNAKGTKGKGHAGHGKLAAYTVPQHNSYTTTFSTGFRERIVSTLTFLGPDYTLHSKTATSDSGQFNVTDKLDYVYYTTTTGKHHKRKKHTEQFNGTIHINLGLSFD